MFINKHYQILFALLFLVGPTLAHKKTKKTKSLAHKITKKTKSLAHKETKKTKSTKQCKRSEKAKTPKRCKDVDKSYGPDLPASDNLVPADIQSCAAAYVSSEFNFFDITNYDRWFNDDTLLSVTTTGLYKGASNIAEYVNFVFSKDLFTEYTATKSAQDVGGDFPALLPIVANDTDCVLTFAVVNSIATNAATATPNAGPVTMDTTVGFRLQFSIVTSSILVERIELVSY
jgi:hypothetical protein